MAITDTIKDIIVVKVKPRQDGYADQFSRIFLMKLMMIASLLVGLNWYSDEITCIIPGSLGIDHGFVKSACWINGLYIFKEIRYHKNEIGYYGIPLDIGNDGLIDGKTLCKVRPYKEDCKPMEKTFFLQYQYMVFIMASLAMLYHAPYPFFRWVNQDLASLKKTISDDNDDEIVKNYFNHQINSPTKMKTRVFGNYIVKILYVVVNVAAFLITDGVLNGGFRQYGNSWTKWLELPNSIAYDYMGRRSFPKPGNALIPSFGLCEIYEGAQDLVSQKKNQQRVICEISQHVLYQYVLIVTWFFMVFGIVVSVLGLCIKIVDHILTVTCFLGKGQTAQRMYKVLTLREIEYLEMIRQKDISLYGRVVRKLKEQRHGMANDEKPIYRPSYNAPERL